MNTNPNPSPSVTITTDQNRDSNVNKPLVLRLRKGNLSKKCKNSQCCSHESKPNNDDRSENKGCTRSLDRSSKSDRNSTPTIDNSSEENLDNVRAETTSSDSRPSRTRQRLVWSADTINNEFMGKKKSKCCCIYEAPKEFDESSSDSSSDSPDRFFNSDDEEKQKLSYYSDNCMGHKSKCYRKVILKRRDK